MTSGDSVWQEGEKEVIATTSHGEKIYIQKPPKPGQFVRRAWRNTGRRIRTSMEYVE
ncbi:hypothetical protein QP980_11205 [Corynebacterium coyleae]|uniref:hypothetical protein n=1 Tax=Corynebacterium coyleae TaxID=53374 RepID=UPI00254EA804|nr:hypothetical protein [Corynebacterium coyleae]MDK8824418.1 hypothetical protein [Corynebacterium coyleae]